MDYYSLLRNVEEDLKGQSEEIANIFIKADFNPKYVSLNDGIIEKKQIVFYQKVYEIIRTMVSSEKNNIIDKINNFTRLNKVNKKQEEILSKHFFDDTIINDNTGKKKKTKIIYYICMTKFFMNMKIFLIMKKRIFIQFLMNMYKKIQI